MVWTLPKELGEPRQNPSLTWGVLVPHYSRRPLIVPGMGGIKLWLLWGKIGGRTLGLGGHRSRPLGGFSGGNLGGFNGLVSTQILGHFLGGRFWAIGFWPGVALLWLVGSQGIFPPP